jgi:glyoxylate/hydroxypyruvate reductase
MNVAICVPLSVNPVPEVSGTGPGVRVSYPLDLLPPQRFAADHKGSPDFARSPGDEERFWKILAETDVTLGFPGDSAAGLRALAEGAPRLRWVQGTAAGTGEQLAAAGLNPADLARLTVTSAAGLHAQPLAEFAVFGMLSLLKDIDILTAASAERTWLPRWPMRLLSRSHVVVVGLGGIGREVARLCGAFGATVTGVRRTAADGAIGLADLDAVLPTADAVVVTLPGTAHTRGLFSHARLSRLPSHSVLVNVGRGSAVDSVALADALDAGALRGAVLDVTDIEPLPADSRLWNRPNVIISPHTAALTSDEDDKIVALFAANLRSFLAGEPMRNTVNVAKGY